MLLVVDRPVESEPMPVDVEVDSEAIELVAELRPVEVDVDSEATVLLVGVSPVAVECAPLCVAPMPVELAFERDATCVFVRPRRCEARVAGG
ncbi:hypothetical protein, partial [Burkholderia pseudomallei]|uniref:hypothetical protein n=1 Tax=Burkholderia pseudomallei TaxID=28450 RepID=UPI0015E1A6C6